MKIKLRIIPFLVIMLTASSCTKNRFDAFEENAASFAKSDGYIDKAEFNKLKDEVSASGKDRDFNSFYIDEALSDPKLITYLKSNGYKIKIPDSASHKKDEVNVYLENSGSMFGYVDGDTEYKDALTELLVQLGSIYGKKNIRLFFINTKIYPIDFKGNVAMYPSTLTPNKLKVVGNVTHSDINDIYRQIVEKTNEKTISILVSDCIYSAYGKDTAGKLEIQKSLTKDVFQDTGVSALIAKLNSGFNGFYYPKNNTKQRIKGQSRPYYMSVLGKDGTLGYFYNKIKFQPDFKGYENKVFLSAAYNNRPVYYTLINTKNTTGFRSIRGFSDSGSERGMEDMAISDRDGNSFIFSIAVDLSGIPIEEEIITNPLNYNFFQGNYKIKGITRYDPKLLKPVSLRLISKSGKKPTHIFTLSATTNRYTDLEFGLKNEIPKWVYLSSTNDDTDIKNLGSKTFGLSYLVEGINEALQKNATAKTFFRIKIKINQ